MAISSKTRAGDSTRQHGASRRLQENTRAPETLERAIPARKHPPSPQSQPGSTSCRPKPSATRLQTLMLSPALALGVALHRMRLHDLLRCVRLDSRGLLWQFLMMASGTTWTVSDRDRAPHSGLSIDRRVRFIRHY